MDILDTPAWKATKQNFDEVIEILRSGNTTFDEYRKIVILSVGALKGGLQADERDLVAKSTASLAEGALYKLEELSLRHPESEADIMFTAFLMANAWSNFAMHSRLAVGAKQKASMGSLIALNAQKGLAKSRALSIAAAQWRLDTDQELRIGDMAERVYRALAAEGFTEALPGTAERIKEWIKPAAPEYARKGGRRRKPS